jgi:hypothetical protein
MNRCRNSLVGCLLAALLASPAAAQPDEPAPTQPLLPPVAQVGDPVMAEKMRELERQLDELRGKVRELSAPKLTVPPQVVEVPPQRDMPDSFSLGQATPDQVQEGSDSQLKFLAYFFTKGEASNFAPRNDLLQGRLVGRLFGPNTTTTSGATTFFAEQRLIPFIVFEPKILNGFARLRASFELNWTWGDSSYGVGGNFGGALSGRGVNLQTQNVHIEFKLKKGWYMTVGLQRLWDNPRDPYRTFFSTMSLTGNRLSFWGSDAVGVSVWGYHKGQTIKIGVYDLYENKIQEDDNVWLFEVMTSRDLGRNWSIGATARYLRDTSNGLGGVSVLGQGPNSRLAEYNGVFRFPLGDAKFEGHVAWAGLDVSYNPELTGGRLGGSAFVTGNFGKIGDVTVAGVAANLRLGVRYGATKNNHVVAEAIFTSGDGNGIADKLYTGVLTGNTWGAPAAVYISHGAYLLLPHPNVVNRLSPAVFDISNAGYGLTAGTLNASYDLVRNLLTGKIGVASGAANIAPPGGGHFIGFEANASLVYRPRVWFSIEAHGAYMRLGNFYDSPTVNLSNGGAPAPRPSDPWLALLAIKWLMF